MPGFNRWVRPTDPVELLTETPDCTYSLLQTAPEMVETEAKDDCVQEVKMTREEFIALKAHLAVIRKPPSITPKPPAKTTEEIQKSLDEFDLYNPLDKPCFTLAAWGFDGLTSEEWNLDIAEYNTLKVFTAVMAGYEVPAHMVEKLGEVLRNAKLKAEVAA